MDKNALHRVATVVKAHGIRGELILKLQCASLTLNENEPVFLDIDGGLVPFFVSSYEQTARQTAILLLCEVNNEQQARSLKGIDLYIDPIHHTFTESTEFRLSELEGYQVTDETSGFHGEVIEFIDIPKNPLLRVTGADEEFLIPLQEEMILHLDAEKKQMVIRAPEGLLHLDNEPGIRS